MRLGFLPRPSATLRMAARSASRGTPVKSCSTTRATTKGISSVRMAWGCQLASWATCSGVTFWPSQLRSTDSSTMRTETGRRLTLGWRWASAGSEWNFSDLPDAVLKDCRVSAKGGAAAEAVRAMGAPLLVAVDDPSILAVDHGPVCVRLMG